MFSLTKIIEYLFYSFIFLLPWQTRWIWHQGILNNGYWEYGTFSLYGIDILLAIIFVLVVVSLFLRKDRKLKSIVFNSKAGILGLCLLVTGLTIIWAYSASLGLYYFVKILEGIILVWVIAKVNFSWTKLALSFVAAGVIQAGLGVFQFFSQEVIASKWLGISNHLPSNLGDFVIEIAGQRWLRAYGSLPHPNMLAVFLVICLIILAGLYINNKNKKTALIYFVFFIIISAGLFFTFSRTAWLALAIAVLFWATIAFGKKIPAEFNFNLLKLLTILFIVFIILTAVFPDLVFTRLGGGERLEKQSVQERIDYTKQAYAMIKKHWLLGVGIGNYTLAVQKEMNPDLASWSYQPVHNIFLLSSAELGVMSLLFWFIVFYLVYKRFKEPGGLEMWIVIFFISFLVLLIAGCFDHFLWTLHFGIILFWLILGIFLKKSQT